MASVIHITDTEFDVQVLSAKLPVLVDFWADWCGPCKAIAPILDDIATQFDGKIIIAKVNVDECQQIPVKYGIRSIPTLIIFKDGVVQGTQVGAVSKAQLVKFIDASI